MKALLTLFFISAFYTHSSGQIFVSGSDDIKVNVRSGINFNYNSVDDLLNTQTFPNAVDVEVKAKSSDYNIMAQVEYPGKVSADVPENWLSLKLASKTCPNAAILNEELVLKNIPQPLFRQPASSGTDHFNYIYHLILNPLNTFVRPDNYNFAIIFTMTHP